MQKSRKVLHKSLSKNFSQGYWRIRFLVFFIIFIAGAMIFKLYSLQVSGYETFEGLAESQHSSTKQIDAKRGEIFLQDEKNQNYPLAINQQLNMAFAVPKEMKDKDFAVEKLSEILGLEKNELGEKFNGPNQMYQVLKHKLSDDESQRVREAKISGIYLIPENFRYYPGGELASQVVGFMGSNGNETRGMYGLESFWDDKLKGESGILKQQKDSRGRWISVSDRSIDPAKDGMDLVLTINHTVQYEVEKILKESLELYGADNGSVIVLQPKTGRILAMANQPGFNPNDFSKTEDISVFSNPAIGSAYESGSVFKTFTEAIGIDQGKINPNTTYVDTGVVVEAGYDIRNSDLKSNGVQTMTQVLEKSLNTGVIFIEKLVGNAKFADYVKRFGFGTQTGIELPGEAAGRIDNLKNLNSDINFFTASFGQGITVTPLQLAMGYGAIANDGMLMKPHIVEKIRHSDGSEEEIKPEEVRQVISSETSKLMGEMLRSVVVNGHGKRGDVPGYLIGGKTGTAQVAKQGSLGYEEGMNIGSFAGYGPINDPQFVIVVKMFNPKNVEWAESSAAPTFGRVMKFLLEYYKVKPTEDPKTSPLAKMAPENLAPAKPSTELAPIAQDQSSKKDKDKKDK